MGLLVLLLSFALLLLLTLVWKKSLLFSAAVTLLFAVVLQGLFFGFEPVSLLRSFLHGSLTAVEIGLLVFGALSFFTYLKAGDFLPRLQESVRRFSTNQLIVVLLLCFFFGSFIEGISGFGTPAMIIAPLLLALRFPPYLAAALPLLANTLPVLFGAVGTPVKIGFAELPATEVPVYASVLMAAPILLLPMILKRFLAREQLLATADSKIKTTGIALGASMAFLLPFVLLSFTGPEFPTLLSGIIGLLLWVVLLRFIRPCNTAITGHTGQQFFHAFRPYLFVAALLLLGKFVLQAKWMVGWPAIGLQKTISLFQPGLIFLIALFFLHLFSLPKNNKGIGTIFRQTSSKLPPVLGTIACLAVLARLLSEHLSITGIVGNSTSMPAFVFTTAAVLTGLLGSFMAGSATVSNLLFGAQWVSLGEHYNLPVQLLLACQLAGAAIGNALSIQNIVMVQAVLNEKGLESAVIRSLWKVILLFVVLISLAAAVIGWLFIA